MDFLVSEKIIKVFLFTLNLRGLDSNAKNQNTTNAISYIMKRSTKRYGLRGKEKLGSPPNFDGFGDHPDMDSSSITIKDKTINILPIIIEAIHKNISQSVSRSSECQYISSAHAYGAAEQKACISLILMNRAKSG